VSLWNIGNDAGEVSGFVSIVEFVRGDRLGVESDRDWYRRRRRFSTVGVILLIVHVLMVEARMLKTWVWRLVDVMLISDTVGCVIVILARLSEWKERFIIITTGTDTLSLPIIYYFGLGLGLGLGLGR